MEVLLGKAQMEIRHEEKKRRRRSRRKRRETYAFEDEDDLFWYTPTMLAFSIYPACLECFLFRGKGEVSLTSVTVTVFRFI